MQRSGLKKEEMVQKLVSLSVSTALSESQRYWLSDLFENGFIGYGNYSRQQLQREMELRGLEQPSDEAVSEAGEYDFDEDLETDSSMEGISDLLPDLQSGRDFE
jgi:hypothetical protein